MPCVALVGFGRFAQAVARTLPEIIRVIAVRPGAVIAEHPPLPEGSRLYRDDSWLNLLHTSVDTVWITTPDTAIGPEAVRLAQLRDTWEGITVLHSSGATSAHALDPLMERGARTLALHPNGSFTGADPIPAGLLWTISSSDPADHHFAHKILTRIDPAIVTVADQFRPLYHAAASVASNFSVTLFAVAVEFYERAGIPRDLAADTVANFIAGSAARAASLGPRGALTGPIARGEESVVDGQAAAIQAVVPELERLFMELAEATRRMLRREDTERGGDHERGDSGMPDAQSGQESAG